METQEDQNRRKPGIWFFLMMFGLGPSLLLITCGMYRDSAWKDKMSTRSPTVCMKIAYGTKGAGTVKYPDNIYAEYQGKTYKFEMGRKYYRSLLGVDTIQVYYDKGSDRAFLLGSDNVRHFAVLYFLLGGIGIAVTIGSIWEFIKLILAGHGRE
ncbi:hypothetical protein ACFP1I_13155 [Dyadobacter subterraneus]|uniref:DUF3592 domain-containing protein n=1 Tax=Dyadobacter subterraneus TaxID=2773304 RepID=A0ABR9W9L8_9BACT|nr:hypothetical protein [Dyadobacter subterraneus]MBE9462180.1 hypothetical protein [Dyadobacter subterraneus]